MVTITKVFRFEACHRLPSYEGPCHNLHGHSYRLEATVAGEVRESGKSDGMVMDLKELGYRMESVAGKYDHANLNEYFRNPTAEVVVERIAADLSAVLPQGARLVSCRLWETETGCAEWRAGDVL